MMEAKKEKKLTITLVGDEIEDFRNAIKKLADQDKMAGFVRSSLTESEMNIIKEINKTI